MNVDTKFINKMPQTRGANTKLILNLMILLLNSIPCLPGSFCLLPVVLYLLMLSAMDIFSVLRETEASHRKA
jgi:hypothetical protein